MIGRMNKRISYAGNYLCRSCLDDQKSDVVIRLTEIQNAMYWLLLFRQGKSVEHLLYTTVILISKLRSIDESLEIYYKSTGWFRYQ